MKNYNPKSLKGQDKLNRIKDLMGRMSTLNESTSHSELELIKKGPNGIVYGIVRENHDYFIKTSNKNGGSLLAEDFNYIGGLQNKFDERYKSYSEALKQLNLKFDMLNESYGIEKNTNLFESDGVAFGGGTGFGFVMEKDEEVEEGKMEVISDSEEDIEEQKKVLKVDAPKTEEPVEDEVDVDMSGDSAEIDMEMDDEGDDMEMDDMGSEEGELDTEDEDTKKIQKYTGKIGQMLRDMDEADPELEKYVINSIISALHLDEMDEDDKEDIIAKIEGDEEEEGEGVDLDLDSDLDLDAGEEGDETAEVETGEEEEIELAEGKKKKEKKELEITPDMIAMLLKDGECSCSGQKLVYKPKEKKETNESIRRNKKSILESYLRNKTRKTLRKVLKESRHICERCMGKGCSSCLNEHHMGSKATYDRYPHYDKEAYIMDEEMMYEKLVGNQDRLDRNKNGKIDAEDFRMLRKGRKDRRRNIDEEEMGVMDAISTGQGYLSATGDLDRDFDGIPNRLDLDNNGDGELDFAMNNRGDDFIELDIDFLRNTEAPVKEPGIKEGRPNPLGLPDLKKPEGWTAPEHTTNHGKLRGL